MILTIAALAIVRFLQLFHTLGRIESIEHFLILPTVTHADVLFAQRTRDNENRIDMEGSGILSTATRSSGRLKKL